MANRCLNKVMLIGNLTRDPELRYTPAGVAVCTFGVATNRRWTTQGGEQKEDAQFHRIVTWNRLAELCSQLLAKGRRVYLEGRLQYREYTDSEGNKRQVTEIVAEDMIILDARRQGEEDRLEEELEKTVGYPEEEVATDSSEPASEKDSAPTELEEKGSTEEGVSEQGLGGEEGVSQVSQEKTPQEEESEEEEAPSPSQEEG